MTIAPVPPARTGNPGIVPPWLQRPVNPPVGGTEPAPTPAPAPAPTPARDALGYVRVPGGIIVVDIPDEAPRSTPGRGFGGREGEAVGSDRLQQEQARLETSISDIQARYRTLGIKDSEGNGPVVAKFSPAFPNAAYLPLGSEELGMPADSIAVGVDPRSRTPFTDADDVVAHELAHRVIDHMTSEKLELSPLSEDGAVHESLADTFAALIDDDWVLGEDLVAPIRDMSNPERLGHPDNVNDLDRVLSPKGGHMHPIPLTTGDVARDPRTGDPILVPDWHVVAGIPNKAASLIGEALGRDTTAKIYLKAVRDFVRPGQQVEGLALATLKSASALYGGDSPQYQATQDAWDAVGVLGLLDAAREQAPATR
ncbi:MAG: nprE [Thermoleophilia bacterium]|nr:nprE [Thermoleophilia bacterium]